MQNRQIVTCIAAFVGLFAAAPMFGGVIYDSIPSPLPASLVSQSFQAGRISEFGDLIAFGAGPRSLTSVTVAMVTWGYFSKYNALAPLQYPTNTGGWIDPAITLNIYSVNNSGAKPAPGSLIGSVTDTNVAIPWRPEPTPACGGTLWMAPDGCHNGMLFEVSFDFSSQYIMLPDEIIYGIAYNTQSGGQNPTGQALAYNDLNVGLNNAVSIGSNPNSPLAYLSGTIAQSYADNGAGGIKVFRLDTGGTHTNVAIAFEAAPEPGTLGTIIGGELLLLAFSIRRRQVRSQGACRTSDPE
jgi:hypothetical protein